MGAIFVSRSVFAAELTGYNALVNIPFSGNVASYDPNSLVDGFRYIEIDGTIRNTGTGESVFEDEYLEDVDVFVEPPSGGWILHETIDTADVQLYKQIPINSEPWDGYRLYVDTDGLTEEGLYNVQLSFNFESNDYVEVEYTNYFKLDRSSPTLSVVPIDSTPTNQEKLFTISCEGESDTDHCLGTLDGTGSVIGNLGIDLAVKGNFCDNSGDGGKICDKDPTKIRYEVCDGTGRCSGTISLGADLFYYDPYPPKGGISQLLRIDEASGTDPLVTTDRDSYIEELNTVTTGGGDLIDQRTTFNTTGTDIEAHSRYVFDLVDDRDDDLDVGDSFDFNGNTYTIPSLDYAGPEADPDGCGASADGGLCRDYASGGAAVACATPSLVLAPFYHGTKEFDGSNVCRQRFVRCSNSPSHRGFWDRSSSQSAGVDLAKCTANGVAAACQIAATEIATTDVLDPTLSTWNVLLESASSISSALTAGTDYIIRYRSGSWDADNTTGGDPQYFSTTFLYTDEFDSPKVVGFAPNTHNTAVLGTVPSPVPEVRIRYNGGDIQYKMVDPDGDYLNNADGGLRFDIFQVVCDNDVVCGDGYEYDGGTDSCVAINSCNPVIGERIEVDPWAWGNSGDPTEINQSWSFSTALTGENAELNNTTCTWGCVDGTEQNPASDGCNARCDTPSFPTLSSNMWINDQGATTPSQPVVEDFVNTGPSGAAACSWGCSSGYEPNPTTGTCELACNGTRPTSVGETGTWANGGRQFSWETWSFYNNVTPVSTNCAWGCYRLDGYGRVGNGCEKFYCANDPDTLGQPGTWANENANYADRPYAFRGGINPTAWEFCRWGCDNGYGRDGNGCYLPTCDDTQLPATILDPGMWHTDNAFLYSTPLRDQDYSYVSWADNPSGSMYCSWGCEAGFYYDDNGTNGDYTDDTCSPLSCNVSQFPATVGLPGTWTAEYPSSVDESVSYYQWQNSGSSWMGCGWGCESGYIMDDGGTSGDVSDDSCVQLQCDPANLPTTNGSAGTWVNNTSQYNGQPYTFNTSFVETLPPNHCEWGCESGYTQDDNGTPGVTGDDSCI